MKKALTDMLICPACLPDEHKLKEKVIMDMGEDILTGSLTCPQCKNSYAIQDGIAFLDPASKQGTVKSDSRYESRPLLSSYLWSHYADLLHEENASTAYCEWAELLQSHSGVSVDTGSAVGRFAFEMSPKCDFIIGIDNSLSFIRAARELMTKRQVTISLYEEGNLTRETVFKLPETWNSNKVEFIVGDALALPFKSNTISSLSSLNLIDKIPIPLNHLKEMNRVTKEMNAQFLFSDPFSWSAEVADEKDWLGGKTSGIFTGRGKDNIIALLQGKNNELSPEWRIEKQGHVWWKIRTHSNHFEQIRSCYIKAER